MKRGMFAMLIAALAVAAAVLMTSDRSVVADDASEKPDNVFQKMADAISVPVEMEVKPLKEIKDFQHTADGIEEGSQKAKPKSIRGQSKGPGTPGFLEF